MRRRLVTLALASTSLVAVAFLVPLFGLVDQLALDRALRPAELAARSVAPTVPLLDDETLGDVLRVTEQEFDGMLRVVRPDGQVVGDPAGEVDEFVRRAREERVALRVPVDGGQRILVPVTSGAGVAVVEATVAVDRSGVVLAWTALGVLGVVLVVGATLLADRLGRTTVRAAQALEATAERLSEGDLAATAAVVEPPDLARVSGALDQLAGRIDQLLTEAREDAADVSHRLRTPLTALRLDVESLHDEALRTRLLADLDALDTAVSQVIDDARAPLRVGAGEGADVVAVTRDRVAFWAGLAEDEGRPVAVDLPDEVVRTGMPLTDVTTVLDVLLDNAFRHTPVGTAVSVAVEVDDDTAVLVVADDGPGLPQDIDVLDRGRSGGGGSGLGLDIVARSVRRAGGSLEITGPPGRGTTVRCRLPRLGESVRPGS